MPPDPTPLPVRFARAVLMMLPPSKGWDKEDHAEWQRLTGTPLATIDRLRDMARQVEEDTGKAMAVARQQALREAEAVCQHDECKAAIRALREARNGNA